MADSDFDKITPTDISLTSSEPVPDAASATSSIPPLGMGDTEQAFNTEQKNRKVLWGIFGLLLMLVLGVIFILPSLVATPELEPTVVVVTAPSSGTGSGTEALQISPFQEAQILRQRESAQNVLAALLELQESLEEKEVGEWAKDDMQAVLEYAQSGDDAYSRQSFIEADLEYAQGLERLQAIEASIPDVFAGYMETGQTAILAGEPEQAQQAFTIALSIEPSSTTADAGLGRSQVLAEVLEVLARGVTLHENGQLENAREIYQQALAIDGEHVDSREAFTQVVIDILDRDFSGFMSQGYTAIQADEPDSAETFFRQALALKPESEQALAALEQTSDQITFNAITIHLDAAQLHVSAERWAEALSEYEQAIIVDPNVVSAVDGRRLSNSRNNLDIFLQNTIEAPLRLAEASVYEQVRSVYGDANNIASRGPRLAGQLQIVGTLIEKATQAVNVSFQSDGITDVTIARVSPLGQFMSQTLALTPGAYVALGVRDGFRDVRTEFIVPFEGQAPLVTVQCDEAI